MEYAERRVRTNQDLAEHPNTLYCCIAYVCAGLIYAIVERLNIHNIVHCSRVSLFDASELTMQDVCIVAVRP